MAVDTQTIRHELEVELQRLQSELEQLELQRAALVRVDDPTPGHGNHSTEEATESLEQERTLALMSNLRQLIEQVQAALRRVDNGTYGICETCSQPISPERLQALPFATQCVRCKEKQKNRH